MTRFIGLVCISIAAVAFACSAGSKDETSDASATDDSTPTFSDACAATCSADLHDVLDCSGHVTQTCAPDQGCAAGACVDACAAAAASQTTIGCDYWTIKPDVAGRNPPGDEHGDCYAIFVANTWSTPVTAHATWNGQTLDFAHAARIPQGSGASTVYSPLPNGQIPAGQVAILFAAASPPTLNDFFSALQCPAPAALTIDPGHHDTSFGHAFHITTSAPVASYQIYPFGGGNAAYTSASLLLPTSTWDTSYVGVDAYDSGQGMWTPWIDVVAAQDGTEVTFTPSSAIAAKNGVAAMPAHVATTVTLSAGQSIELASDVELNGTGIQSSKPVAVFGGNDCMIVPDGAPACDSAHQQLPPVKALGSEYVGARPSDRYAYPDGGAVVESPPWRIVGAAAGTTLAWDPSPPQGAPTEINAGQMVEFRTSQAFVVHSQDDAHPFYMAQYMTGCGAYWQENDPKQSDCRGDPEFVNIVPAKQFLQSYVLFTDPTYPETELVVVRARGANGFADVALDCAGTVSGFEPAAASGRYEIARVRLQTGNFTKVGNCDNGRHAMHSDAPFGVTVWGWGSGATGGAWRCDPHADGGCSPPGFFSIAVSYAYPAGMSVHPLNDVVFQPN